MKGSGGDLRTARRDGFASLYLEKVRSMKAALPRESRSAGRRRRSKTRCTRCTRTASSTSTRGPARSTRRCTPSSPISHVDHLHPNAVIAVAASVNQERLTPRDLRRRRHLRPLAAAGVRHRPHHRAADQGAPEGAGRAAGPARHELLERRRQDLLRDGAGDRRTAPRATSRRATAARRRSAGAKYAALPEAERQRVAGRRSCPGCAAGSPQSAAWSARSRTTRRCCAS